MLAWCVLVLLSLLGAAAILLPLAFRIASVRARVDAGIVAAVKGETGLDVQLRIDRPLWPPGVVVRDVSIASKVAGRPFATVREARVTVRPFSLLSGDVVVDAVELDGLSVDAELREGEALPTNLPLALKVHPPKAKTTSLDPPFRALSLTAGHFQVRYVRLDPAAEPVGADISGVDVDIDATAEGSTTIYNLRLDRAMGSVHTPRVQLAPPPLDRFLHAKGEGFVPHKVWDEDSLCGMVLHAQLTDAPTATVVSLRRFELDAHLDGDEALGTAPSCVETDVADEQLLHVQMLHAEAEMPKVKGVPRIRIGPAARLDVRAPAMLAARWVKLPPVGGWVRLELDLTSDVDLREPMMGLLRTTATGRIEAHQLRLAQYRFGESIAGDLSIKSPLVVSSKKLEVHYGDGLVTLTDLELRGAPIPGSKKQLPLKVNLALKGITLPGLVRELGVSKAAHVRWDLDEGSAKLAGWLEPLMLDGDLIAKTKDLEVGINEVEGSNPGHIVGIKHPIDLSTHVVVRDKYLSFENVRARFGASSLAARVYLGFDDHLEVDATSDSLDLADASPLVLFPVSGIAKLDYKVRGLFGDPVGEGKLSIAGFNFEGFELGDVDGAIAKFRGTVVDIGGYHAKIGDSAYAVPSMRIDLGKNGAPITVDALGGSDNFSLADFYRVFHLDADPRWKDIKGHVGVDARTHLVVGGKDDPCGTGHLTMDLQGTVLAMDVWGERYDGGRADLTIDWFDFGAGGLGMDLDMRAATLHKKGGGSVVLSGRIARGGRLGVHATVGGVSLKALSAMPQTTIPIDGTLDAVADVSGTFDDMTVDADVSLSPIHVSDRTLERSHLHVVRRPLSTVRPSPSPDGRGCYPGRKLPPFDIGRYNSDPVEGEFVLSGTLFGDTLGLTDFHVTDQRAKVASGTIAVRGLDLGPLGLLRPRPAAADLTDQYEPPPAPVPLEGRLSADVQLDRLPIDAWWDTKGSVANLTLDAESANLGVATIGTTPTITFGPEGAKVPETAFKLSFGEASTKVVVAAEIERDVAKDGTASTSPRLTAKLTLPMLPISRLEPYFPRLERSEGTLRATISVGGTVATPTWEGEVDVENGAFTIKGFTMPFANINGKIEVDPKAGIHVAKLHGEVGGGTLDVTGGAKLAGFGLGDVDLHLAARGVHFRYGEGIALTVGGDLRATWSPTDPGQPNDPLHVDGAVDVDGFLYERPVKVFDVNALQAAQRTEVDVYDPARDMVVYDVELRSKQGFHLRNNLADATLAIGQSGLRAIGSNQRGGLVGDVYVVQGGLFRFRNHDFEIREGTLRFADETKIDPNIDVVAVTEYRRAAGAGSGSSAEWRIKLHAYGSANDLKLELTSDPPLSQEDAILLLTIGMTRAEANALGGGGVAGGAGLDFLANLAGVDQTVKQAIPVIDDFRFGTAYSVKTGRTEPQVTVGKRLTSSLRASVTSSIAEQRDILSNIEWQLSRKLSLQGSYDNINDVTSSSVGNVGLDLRLRLEFEQ